DDLSLGEIAEEFGISRQAVYYTLKRGLNRLKRIEEKLGLVKRFIEHFTLFEEIKREIDAVLNGLPYESRVKLEAILGKIDGLIERGDLLV
ncbi:MAG: DNA-binding protein, partial [Chloroflexi bacterium]|nr:DNA-binding protein [Chloroflexota bacterium]